MSNFIRIEYDALTDDDLAGIIRCCRLNPLGHQAAAVVQMIAAQNLSFWRLRTETANVRLVFQIKVHPNGNELLIYALFGRGLFANIPECVKFARLLAKQYRCQAITGEVYSKGLAKLYEKLGAKPVCQRFAISLEDLNEQ